jgi:hypothetical protein
MPCLAQKLDALLDEMERGDSAEMRNLAAQLRRAIDELSNAEFVSDEMRDKAGMLAVQLGYALSKTPGKFGLNPFTEH